MHETVNWGNTEHAPTEDVTIQAQDGATRTGKEARASRLRVFA
jgi:hypothetical protein